jgi:ubiquinone/menaquinone biosynthesis C-methylase UbiE
MRTSGRKGSPSGDAYLFPRHPTEFDRLDIQHYALRKALNSNYVAPVETPATILDIGCGTGQWAFELCGEFPDALVIGLDLVSGKPDRPANYRLVRANVLYPLPFLDDRFEFVHQRLLRSGVPVRSWATLMRELARVARPGGWVELVEAASEIEPAGTATEHLFELMRRLGRELGLDTTGIVYRSLDQHLRRAGLVEVQTHSVQVPIGEWGASVGSLMASDMRAVFTRLSGVFQAKFGVSTAECLELIRTMQQELEEHRSRLAFTIAFGRKPLA